MKSIRNGRVLKGGWLARGRELQQRAAMIYGAALVIWLASLVSAPAQFTLLSETFEQIFPTYNGWTVGDDNTNGPAAYWDDKNSAFGSVEAHEGSWKGYCAGIGYVGTTDAPYYTNHMRAFMSKTLNLSAYAGANLVFWYNIPSIETSYDRLRAYIDTNLVFTTTNPTTNWARKAISLTPYVGSSRVLRFEFESDFTINYEGAYLDDISVRAFSQPAASSLVSLSNMNYTGYVLASDAYWGRSNIQANAVFRVENFSGAALNYTNVLRYRLRNAGSGGSHPIYDVSGVTTNAGYTYNITNVFALTNAADFLVTNTAYLRPAAWMSHFAAYDIECRLFTNGVLAQTLTTTPTNYYHFTNTANADLAYNVLLNQSGAGWSRVYKVDTIPGQDAFRVNATYEMRRWDDTGSGMSSANVPVVFNYTLRDNAGTVIPLTTNSSVFYAPIQNYEVVFIFGVPAVVTNTHTLQIRPAGQLDSINRTYYLTVSIGHINNTLSGQVIMADTVQTTTNRLLHFNGNLAFGAVNTRLTALGAAPPVNAPVAGLAPTTLTGAGGVLVDATGHTYAAAAPLSVNLNVSGDARVTGGAVTLSAPTPDNDSVSRVRFQRGSTTLSSLGGITDVRVTLPTGSGYRTNNNAYDIIYPYIHFSDVRLTSALEPEADLTFNPGGSIFFVEENKPVWMRVDAITWQIASGRFDFNASVPEARYVREDEYDYLESVSNLLVNPVEMGDKRSNDKYWRSLNDFSGVAMRADAGSNALITAKFGFRPGGFRSHFPYDTVVEWTGSGNMNVRDDLVDAGPDSFLDKAEPVQVPYTRDCPDCGGAGSEYAMPAMKPADSRYSFTLDGGLVGVGPTQDPLNLEWGAIGPPVNNFAQQAQAFVEASFHMPGAFLRGDQNILSRNQGPTTLLYSGFFADNPAQVERPMTADYTKGFADYAGLNFRCRSDGDHRGVSTIAGREGIDWLLTGRSKYYVRYAGVSGIHEAVAGTFPTNLTLWGYKFTFQNYGLSYLDSQNHESRTDGAINLPKPAGFVQGFEDMVFTCLGAPDKAELPSGDGFKSMNYWAADFKTLAIEFQSKNGCSPTDGQLVLGIQGYASHVNKPLYGNVGFLPNGDQIPRQFGLPGVDSRLKLPNVIKIKGPSDTSYAFTPVADAYYNRHADAPADATTGWINIFGKLDVPFFEDLQLHLQTSCRTNGVESSNSPIHLAGGWPRVGTANPNHGWVDAIGVTPFITNFFDWNNRGWPEEASLTIGEYRNNTVEKYHPRAQRNWLGFVEFDYPLAWNNTLRTFKSWTETQNKLLIVEVEHQIKYLDNERAEIDFGAQYDGLPSISVANLAINALDESTGVAQAVIEAATEPVHEVLSTGVDEFGKLLDTQMHDLMDEVFDRTVDPVVDQFYATMSNQWASAWNALPVSQRQQFVVSVNSNLANIFIGNGPFPAGNNLSAVLRDLGSGADAANNLIGQIERYLGDVTNAINSIVGVISNTPSGPIGSNVYGLITKVGNGRPIVPKMMESLVGNIAPQFIDAVVGPALQEVLTEIEPALTQITETLNQTRNAITQVEAQLHGAGGFVSEIDNTFKSFSSQMTNVSRQVSLSVTQYFGELNYSIDNPFQQLTAAEVKGFVRQKIEDQFFATEAAARAQTILRQRLYDLDAAMRQQIDSVFQEFNNVMRQLINQSLAELDNSINQCLGDISNVVGAGELNGHALIKGDSLNTLRIDGRFQFKAPDSIELNAFLLIKEDDSDGTKGCKSPAGKFTEVTIGANRVPCDWISPDLEANLEAKFTFDGTAPYPVNLAGQLELVGDLSFETFVLHDLAAALAFGKYENYLALKGGVRFNSYDFSGAIFFGGTCSLDPLILIDPQVADVLGNPPFTGAYCYAQGWLPVSEMVLGVPASCLFNISAGVGAGAFYFVEGPTYGGKMFLGVSGELLCIVSISGEVTMIGVKQGDDLRFKGHGHFEAEVGSCPFCISVSKSVDIIYVNESWHID